MIYQGQEFGIRVDIEKDGYCVLDEYFDTMDAMIECLRVVSRMDEFAGLCAAIAPCRVIRGECESHPWYDEYHFYPIVQLTESEERNIRSFLETEMDYRTKRKYLKERTYVCPDCFRELDDCRCPRHSRTLVQVDNMILPIVRMLREKGYDPANSCSGHVHEYDVECHMSIFITFHSEHNFDGNYPEGATCRSRAISFSSIELTGPEDRARFQKECIEKLRVWADSLPFRYGRN